MGSADTQIGGGGSNFPPTSWTLVREAAHVGTPEGRERLGELLGRYWKPIYHYIRWAWRLGPEDAKDATQGFVERMLEGGYWREIRPDAGSFRSYLKTALQHYLSNLRRSERTRKRGGGTKRVSLEGADLGGILADHKAESPEEAFDREWAGAVFEEALARLERMFLDEGKGIEFESFRRYYLERSGGHRTTYREVALGLSLSESEVRNHLHRVRGRLKALLHERVREYVSGSEEEASELTFLLARNPVVGKGGP